MTDNENNKTPTDSIIKFPCDFTIKIMGKATDAFEIKALDIIKQHFKKVDKKNISKRLSKDGNYLSLSVSVFAKSKAGLDKVYQALSDCDEVLMTL